MGVAPSKTCLCKAAQPRCRGFVLADLGRVFIAQFIQRKLQTVCQDAGALYRLRVGVKEGLHLCFRAQALFGIGQRCTPELIDTFAGSNGG